MRIFLTGATGYIGSAVASALARRGHHVLGLARSKEKAVDLERNEIEPVMGNLDDPRSYVPAAESCAVSIHCAAEYTARYMELDRLTIDTLLTAAARTGLSRTFLYTSGVWVYGDTAGKLVDETTALTPARLVTWRLPHERDILAASAGRVRTLILRPGCVYGGAGSLTAYWFDTASKSGAARIVGDGANRWAMVHLSDLADAYVRAAESGIGGETFNVVDRSRSTVRECAEAASRAAGAGGLVQSQPLADATRSIGPVAECLILDQHIDGSKCARRLGWQPAHGGFVDGVERYHRAWRASRTA